MRKWAGSNRVRAEDKESKLWLIHRPNCHLLHLGLFVALRSKWRIVKEQVQCTHVYDLNFCKRSVRTTVFHKVCCHFTRRISLGDIGPATAYSALGLLLLLLAKDTCFQTAYGTFLKLGNVSHCLHLSG